MEELTAKIVAPLTHPCYAGHFPGSPVLPGVVLLELVAEQVGRGVPSSIPSVKFQRALSPGETFSLRWKHDGARVVFRCDIDGEPVAEGTLGFGAAP